MNRTGKQVAWVCIVSTLVMGCYSSAMIDPRGDDKDRMYTDRIEVVITKEGTKYDFDASPSIVDSAIVGSQPGYQVSLPLSSVATISASDGKERTKQGSVVSVVTKGGRIFEFDVVPAVREEMYVGIARGSCCPISQESTSRSPIRSERCSSCLERGSW